jgi:hypothetical protein
MCDSSVTGGQGSAVVVDKPRRKRVRGRKRPPFVDCVVCGTPVEQRSEGGGRAKTTCSPKCNRRWRALRQAQWLDKNVSRNCAGCGKPSGRLKFCSPACRHPPKPPGSGKSCKRCGGPSGEKKYCSPECRRGRPFASVCGHCHAEFDPRSRTHRFCSPQCRAASAPAKPAKVYVCLNCGKDFTKKKYPSGAYSRQKKYCDRECAFEARRRRLPCTLDNGRKGSALSWLMATWFLDWNDQVSDLRKFTTAPCARCGADVTVKVSFTGSPVCGTCKGYFDCPDCGKTLPRGSKSQRFCAACAKKRARSHRRKARRRQRATHGHEATFRARCRKYNAHYEHVSRREVMERDGWQCRYCRVALLRRYTRTKDGSTDPLSPTIDHWIPLCLGPVGPGHTLGNCVACCASCNSQKSDSDPEDFLRRIEERRAATQTPLPRHSLQG